MVARTGPWPSGGVTVLSAGSASSASSEVTWSVLDPKTSTVSVALDVPSSTDDANHGVVKGDSPWNGQHSADSLVNGSVSSRNAPSGSARSHAEQSSRASNIAPEQRARLTDLTMSRIRSHTSAAKWVMPRSQIGRLNFSTHSLKVATREGS